MTIGWMIHTTVVLTTVQYCTVVLAQYWHYCPNHWPSFNHGTNVKPLKKLLQCIEVNGVSQSAQTKRMWIWTLFLIRPSPFVEVLLCQSSSENKQEAPSNQPMFSWNPVFTHVKSFASNKSMKSQWVHKIPKSNFSIADKNTGSKNSSSNFQQCCCQATKWAPSKLVRKFDKTFFTKIENNFKKPKKTHLLLTLAAVV